MSRWVIPDHWEWTTIDAIAEVVAGGTPNASDEANFSDQGTPWITPADLTGYELPTIQRGRRGLSETGLEASSAKLLPAGAVLFSSRAPIGYCVVAANPIATNQGFKNLILRGGIAPHYVRLYLIASKEYAESQASGTTFPELSAARMKLLSFPLPPLGEQRRIVAKVDELTARSRAARAALAEVPTLLEQFRQSVLASAFRGDLTADWRAKNPDISDADWYGELVGEQNNPVEKAHLWGSGRTVGEVRPEWGELPDGWRWVRVRELGINQQEVVQIGPMSMKSSEFTEAGVTVLNVGCVQRGHIDTAKANYLPVDRAPAFGRYRVKAGDILFTRSGTVGRCAILPEELNDSLITFHLLRVRTSTQLCVPGYLLLVFQGARCVTDQIKESEIGATRAGFNTRLLEEMWIPLPTPQEQLAICDHLRLVDTYLANLVQDVERTRADLDALDQSILAKAFRGELVPQDPAAEPAAVLLARIRSGVSATRSVERGRVKFYILLLLRTWNKPLSREMLERGLVLMLNADVRRAILDRTKSAPKRGKKPGTPPRFVTGLDLFLGEMLDDGDLVPGPEAGFFAEGQHGFDLVAVPQSDLDAVRETAEAMKVIHKDKLQATDADIVSALHGEIYELVS